MDKSERMKEMVMNRGERMKEMMKESDAESCIFMTFKRTGNNSGVGLSSINTGTGVLMSMVQVLQEEINQRFYTLSEEDKEKYKKLRDLISKSFKQSDVVIRV